MISGLDFEDGVLSFQHSHISSSLALLHCHSLLWFPSIWHLFIVLQQCCTVILFFYFLPSGICSSCYGIAALSFSSFISFYLASVHRVTALLHCHSLLLCLAIWHLFIVLQHCCTVIIFFYTLPSGICSSCYSTAVLHCHSLLWFPTI